MEGIAQVVIRSACLLWILSFALPVFAGPEATTWDAQLVDRGKALFTGAQPLAKGGAPCAACHSFQAPGVSGGNLAPDLTDLFDGTKEEDLKDVLKSLDYPVMKKIYADRPLSDEEINALIAFTRAASAGKKEKTSLFFPLSGIAVFICSLAVLMFYSRRIG